MVNAKPEWGYMNGALNKVRARVTKRHIKDLAKCVVQLEWGLRSAITQQTFVRSFYHSVTERSVAVRSTVLMRDVERLLLESGQGAKATVCCAL
jgi:hypothetical protein